MNCKNCGKKVYAKEICSCGEKAPNVNGKGVSVNSVICTVLLAASLLSLIFAASLSYIVNKDLIVETVNSAEITQIEVKNDNGETVKLDQFIYDKYIDDNRITVTNVDNVLNNSFIKNFLVDKIHGIQDYLLDEGDVVVVRSEDIISLIDKNSTLLYNEAGLNFLEPDKDDLRRNLTGLDDFADFVEKHSDDWLGSGLIKNYFSTKYVIFLVAFLVVILCQWLIVYNFNDRRMLKVLKKYGLTFSITSGIMFFITLTAFIMSTVSSNDAIKVSKLILPFCIVSAILFGVGLAIFGAYLIFGRVKNDGINEVPLLDIVEVNGNEEKSITSDVMEGAVTPDKGQNSYSDSDFAPPSNLESTPDEAIVQESVKAAEVAPTIKSEHKEWAEPVEKAVSEAVSTQTEDTPKPKKDFESVDSKKETADKPKKEFVFCTKCGNKNRVNSSFCTKCGNKLRK